MQNLELYYMESCPFCKKVLRFIGSKKMSNIKLCSIDDEVNRARLIEVGGKEQVPCLFIDGKPMYESMDIVNWLNDNVK